MPFFPFGLLIWMKISTICYLVKTSQVLNVFKYASFSSFFSDFQKDSEAEEQPKKKGTKFKPIKVLKRLSHKGETSKSPRKDKTQ